MIKARHTYMGWLVCCFYSGYKLNKAFRSVKIVGDETDNKLPVLMIANHFSWWDGFIQYRLNRKLFGRRFHVMMLEEQLQQNMILNKGGAFSIHKNSRRIIDSLNYSLEILGDHKNLLLLFPQGKIESMHTGRYRFEKGLSYLLKHLRNDIQIIFNVNLVDYFSEKTPSLNVYYKNYAPNRQLGLDQIEEDFNRYADECKQQQAL